MPPFQGGAAGFFSYELSRYLENLPAAKLNDQEFPEMAIGFYDLVLAFDYQQKGMDFFLRDIHFLVKKEIAMRKKRLHWLLNEIKKNR